MPADWATVACHAVWTTDGRAGVTKKDVSIPVITGQNVFLIQKS